MDAIRNQSRHNYGLAGFSLIEVIVSTIIILIACLGFTYLISQLMTARRFVPETKLLLKRSSYQAETGLIDSDEIRRAYDQCNITISDELLSTTHYQKLTISDKSNNKVLMQFSVLPDTSDLMQLFQK